MATKNNEKQFDLRTVERRIAKGEIDPKDYESYLKSLPDDEKNYELRQVYEEPPPEEATPFVDELTFTSA